ncbi:hypothetical protein ACFT8P_19480 [Streptomyces sp. NPDC057101]|uniref:hypothetical protein n=1 Tax=Streptomyces sp. NPDC057101 TaxID=3346020 RepID=UPI003626C17E
MDGHVVIPGALALLLVCSQGGRPAHGRVPSWQRRRVLGAAPHGWGRLVGAAVLALQARGQLTDDRALRAGLGVASGMGLPGGLVLLVLAQRPARDRRARDGRRAVRVRPAGGATGRRFESGHGFLRQVPRGRLPEAAEDR